MKKKKKRKKEKAKKELIGLSAHIARGPVLKESVAKANVPPLDEQQPMNCYQTQPQGPFTQAIFVAATQCNFFRAEVVTSKSHV